MNSAKKISVVFVCLGNICRSPMAEAVFNHLVDESGLTDQFEVTSGGTGGWHAGERPHLGTQKILLANQVPLNPAKRAQKVTASQLNNADYVIAMDRENLVNLRRLGVDAKLLLDFCENGHSKDVPDPYYNDNFEEVFNLVMEGCNCLLAEIRMKAGL